MRHKIRAFSLIELLVVVAIIGILVTVALPVYSRYSVKSKIIGYLPMMQSMLQNIQATYVKTGQFPANISYNGITIPTGVGFTTIGSNNIYSIQYWQSADKLGAQIAFNLNGLSAIPGSSTSPLKFTLVDMAVREINGTMVTKCGCWGVTTDCVPPTYMPETCQCLDTFNFTNSGVSTC